METRERSLLESERDRSDLVDTEKRGFVRACRVTFEDAGGYWP